MKGKQRRIKYFIDGGNNALPFVLFRVIFLGATTPATLIREKNVGFII